MSQDFPDGYAVTVERTGGAWRVREFEDDFSDLSTSITAVRNLRAEGPAFALLNVEEDYLVIVRPGPSQTRVLISDATMAVDDDFAADILDEAGAEIPDIDPDELDNVDAWADGDFDILADLGLSEEQMSILLDDDADPADLALAIADELGFGDELDDVVG
ncbi:MULTISPECIES: tRNA adenosine deaminase-associated protein [unclassified Corynebacterium]|uniref:tRNA adenosine deaminase-associated protein n=1 Tax=unclassified Corynebacterium TaxID=2624378 RepID=UPI001EF4E8D3|nr:MULTISPECIES: tRNA adenosine deaminase-associated protein [unclassified Corynebacterium]MCG7290668.1 tRNA adenosine deaminase-associated protein [Corynebacterium sp. ACRPZ]MCG7295157.1 tRNA adenosine deaminase-associated protein [Corynebacterium sp. ACRPY]